MTVYIDIKRHVCARVVLVFSHVINIKAARALRIQVQEYTGHFVGGLTRRQGLWLRVAWPLFCFYNTGIELQLLGGFVVFLFVFFFFLLFGLGGARREVGYSSVRGEVTGIFSEHLCT